MNSHDCHVIYVNHNAGHDRLIRAITDELKGSSTSSGRDREPEQVCKDIQPLLDTFGDVHVCATGNSCIAKLVELQDETMTNMKPTLIVLDTPNDEVDEAPDSMSFSRSPSPFSDPADEDKADIHSPGEDIYGLALLQKIITESHLRSIPKWVVPVPIIRPQTDAEPERRGHMTDGTTEMQAAALSAFAANRRMVKKCLDMGAVDVIISPLTSKCITTLEICAYKAHRDGSKEHQGLLEVRQGRKRSWVGVNEQKPFAYLREAMVSGLMNGICRLDTEEDHQLCSAHLAVSSDRQGAIAAAVGHWHFDAHSFEDEELLYAGLLMFKHALESPELEQWRLPTDQLIRFLVACRASYNSFVPYHNFRHVIDVLQATFNFLVHIGALPPFPANREPISPLQADKSLLGALLTPFDALTLLITAIGHDVGHPGVNNGFLTTLNAPLAQLYNDRSVLESFHCAAYSQILRRYWPAVFRDKNMRSLMISSILATDMGLHFEYMKKMGDTQEKLGDTGSTQSWNGRQLEEQRTLACSLLIKCADISNVARHHDIALKWMHILSEEFSRQASMEEELEIKSSLLAPPKKDLLSLANAQLGFMNMLAIPLFQGVADLMPSMRYTVEELETNKALFENIVQELKSASKDDPGMTKLHREGTLSPRTMSVALDHSKNKKSLTHEPAVESSLGSLLQKHNTKLSSHGEEKDDEQSGSSSSQDQPTMRPSPSLQTTSSFQDLNGTSHVREIGSECKVTPGGLQRCSDTTEESVSGAGTGDWASQATSAVTGKTPISPSTQGTSIVSRDSVERPRSAPGLSVHSGLKVPSSTLKQDDVSINGEQDSSLGSSIGRAEGKALKKKSSRFRIKDFHFFKRNKAPSPPLPAEAHNG